ncbi:MAG TPA: aspartate-semialdehyde dehydrogenase [Bacteroidales bacterium]|nr:aspartate-semialdehyde dehydrogenase [Bacteroidales bacterium]
MKVAVVGATGMVGRVMLQILEEQQFPVDLLIPVASEKSVGSVVHFAGKAVEVVDYTRALSLKPQLALFSAGAGTSLKLAPLFSQAGTVVIDNSSAWRKDPAIPLVVPEVNGHVIQADHKIIANPNCSTIQTVMALAPLHRAYCIKRLVISTYQSVSGSGLKGVAQLEAEQQGHEPAARAYPHPIHMNLIPHGGDFDSSGYTSEEQKLVFETRKIMEAPDIAITATVVRVPVKGGHSVSVNIEFEKPFDLAEARQLLEAWPNLLVQDDPSANLYPMPLYAEGRDETFVGRIRRDFSLPSGLNLWVVADNLRKGAATNAVQIAWHMLNNGLLY